MAKTSTSSARRREVRKNLPRRYQAVVAMSRDKRVLWAAGYALLLAAAATAITLGLSRDNRYELGQVLEKPIVARVTFDFEYQEQTQLLREQAERNEYNVYIANRSYLDELNNKLNNLLTNRRELPLSTAARNRLESYVKDGEPTPQWERDKLAFLRAMFGLAILQQTRFEEETRLGAQQRITIVPPALPDPQPEFVSTPLHFFSVEDIETLAENVKVAAGVFKDKALQETVVELVMQSQSESPQPTYKINPQLTEDRKRLARDSIMPEIWTQKANEVMIPAGKAIEHKDKLLIQREAEEFLRQMPFKARLGRVGGLFGTFLLLGMAVWVYIFAYQHRVTRNAMRGLAITLLLLLAQAMAVVLTNAQPQFMHLLATFPPIMITMVLAIAYDQRFALALGATACGIVALSLLAGSAFALVMLVGAAVAVAMLREVRTHSKIVSVGLGSGLAMGAATFVVSLATRPLTLEGAMMRIGKDSLFAIGGGIAASLLVQAVLPLIERAFKVTTAMRLRELTDVSHPLLQRLAQEAPGTYQHSLRIADMAEAAADAIGANGLLCRVGAMYHDIGKVNKPLYFIENQGGGPNRHAKLSPAMSLLIIVGHVKDGIEMAREYGLPPEIRHFIESHHGTTLVEYFYHAARKIKEAEEESAPSEFEFRYPGPKPQTKEAAIMLLCDSVEAATRVLADPTPVRIEQLVDKMANKRLMDNQFDKCNLTLAELHVIQQSITKMLAAIHHSRIKYPTEKKPDPPTETLIPPVQPQSA